MTTRRKLITALAATTLTPWPALAQTRPARIAWLGPGTASGDRQFRDAFKQGLQQNGLIEGRDYLLDDRYADGHYERFPELTREMLARQPAVLIVATISSVRAAQQLTKTVPIIFATLNDPVGAGLVASLARPGGNTTGISNLAEDPTGKLLETLRTAAPKAKRIGVLLNPKNPSNLTMLASTHTVGATLGLTILGAEVAQPEQLETAFAALVKQRPDALLVHSDAMVNGLRERISALALKHRLPGIGVPEFVEAGLLLGFGSSRTDNHRYSATYVKKILGGAKPADLPVEQASRAVLWANLKTAKALGIAMPEAILLRADKVIE